MIYVEVILPIPVGKYFTYSVTQEMENKVAIGKRVVVSFGAKKFYTGIIRNIVNEKPKDYKIKDITLILDEKPLMDKVHLDFQEWISSYYMASLGDVLKASLPTGLRVESLTKVFLKLEDFPYKELKSREVDICELLKKTSGISIHDINEAIGLKNSMNYIRSLMGKGIIAVEEHLYGRYKQKEEKYIKLNVNITEGNLTSIIDSLRRAPKQQQLLMLYLNLSKAFIENEPEKVTKARLLHEGGSSHATYKGLIDKNIFCEYSEVVSRLDTYSKQLKSLNTLNKYQENSLSEIELQFKEKDTVLLHGVTSSGKTEIYIHLIEKYIKEGKQILYLLPEIAITSQIIRRLRSFFGDTVGIYHSKFSDAERVEVWENIRGNTTNESFKVVLGVRSSLFLPFKNLGLIIVDEEHETTYKQHDPAPRYHARDTALMLARLHGAKTLLGSATPSIETYYNATSGKYGFSSLTKRYSGILLPEIIVADMSEAIRKKIMKGVFTPILYNHIRESLDKKKQVILFQNRRGYASFLECKDCGFVVKCKHCDVSLTYHKYENKLSCHYCGYRIELPEECPYCNSENIATKGFGTEKIEMELNKLFPKAKVARLDQDTVSSSKGMDLIIQKFERREIDILVGTQMVSKGLDFDNVAIVGVMNADSMLNYPDFRAYERSFQLMAQVAGRAGRHGQRGIVVIQTLTPKHTVILDVVNHDYEAMYNKQIIERKEFIYPPYFKIIEINIKCNDKNIVYDFSNKLYLILRKIFGIRVYKPQPPLISRVNSKYLMRIILKIELNRSISRAKFLLKKEVDILLEKKAYKRVYVVYDVDNI